MVFNIPKYTQYQLSQMVIEKLEQLNLNAVHASRQFSVDVELLEDVLSQNVKYKLDHYHVVSTILDLSIDELLENEEINPISFRSTHNKEDAVIEERINLLSSFFVEVALLKKMNNNNHSVSNCEGLNEIN